MSSQSRLLWCAAVLLAVSACKNTETPPPPPITVEVAPSEVVADGVSTVAVSITYSGGEAVRLSAARGKWQGSGTTAITLKDGERQATYIPCDSRQEAGCGGTLRINANTPGGSTGFTQLKLVALEMCKNGTDDDGDAKADCQDPDCLDLACPLPGGAGEGTCTSQGTCVCATGAAEVCGDGVDNNCNAQVDCAETTCESKACTLNTGLGGVCSKGACVCPNKPEVCNNGVDDDCDGLVDCADDACQPVGNDAGKVCDAAGNTCAPAREGVSTCSICSGNGGVAQASESLCGDGKDNDCDGKIDCQDADCGSLSCTTSGKVCDADTLLCVCQGPSLEGVCNDQSDNDCDGKVDCADLDCQPNGSTVKSCGANGMTCSSTGTCACSGNGGKAEPKEATCTDGFDNDCDGLADCADLDCRPAGTTAGKACSYTGSVCNMAGQCVCPTGASSETACGDAKDDDCDGLADCFDSDCQGSGGGPGSICGASGQRCSGTACLCPYGEQIEATCFDGVDNDCDGKADCLDPDCGNRQCNAASANYVCTGTGTSATCKDITTSVTIAVTAARTRLPADGVATTTVSATLKDGTTALAAKTVSFAVSTGVGTVSPVNVLTNAQGVATATFTSDMAGGPAVVTASYNTGTTTVFGSVNLDMPKVGQMKVVSQQYPVLGVRYSSFQEASSITFQVIDTNNQPYPAGLAVAFTHAPVGGSYIGGMAVCDSLLCTAEGVTDANGMASVILHSGTVASTVTVSAGATAGGLSASASASNIAIVGAKASGSSISVSCTPRNVPALTTNDCTSSQVGATITCVASFADRFNNVLGVPTTATFSTEAGAAGPPVSTKDGFATGKVEVKGYKLPADVAPLQPDGTEYKETYTNACGEHTHNPRDGLATIIVSAQGEEGFVDGSNGQPKNGVYDPGEYFIDLAEPFVDWDDDGVRDDNVLVEPYTDTNQNGRWDGPNGVWDSKTTIWAETRVVYTGFAAVRSTTDGLDAASRWYLGAVPPVSGATASPTFSVLSTKSGGPTAQSLSVYFTDENFNVPTSGTQYGVAPVGTSAQAKFTTSPTQVDHWGMDFTQQYCSQPSGGTCASECLSAPCYVRTQVGGFQYGAFGVVEIKGGSAPGTDEVRATSTLFNVQTRVPISGVVQ